MTFRRLLSRAVGIELASLQTSNAALIISAHSSDLEFGGPGVRTVDFILTYNGVNPPGLQFLNASLDQD